jgi:hypothetical protein
MKIHNEIKCTDFGSKEFNLNKEIKKSYSKHENKDKNLNSYVL